MSNEQVADFIAQQHIGVVSTIHGNKLESAVVGLVLHDDFKLTFGTSSESRKYANLTSNSTVAVVIGWVEGKTVQYEGTARLLEGDELATYKAERAAKKPASVTFDSLDTQRHFLIEPTWLRYTDTSQSPWLTKDIQF